MMSKYPAYDELPELLAGLMNVVSVGEGATRTWTFEPIDPASLTVNPYWAGDDPPIPQELVERIALARVLMALEDAGFHEVGPS